MQDVFRVIQVQVKPFSCLFPLQCWLMVLAFWPESSWRSLHSCLGCVSEASRSGKSADPQDAGSSRPTSPFHRFSSPIRPSSMSQQDLVRLPIPSCPSASCPFTCNQNDKITPTLRLLIKIKNIVSRCCWFVFKLDVFCQQASLLWSAVERKDRSNFVKFRPGSYSEFPPREGKSLGGLQARMVSGLWWWDFSISFCTPN